MSDISPQALIGQLNWRYAVKRFDDSRKLTEEVWNTLQESLLLTPSSYGLQPWKFAVITSAETKAKLPSLSWGQKQPQECSHMVVLAVRKSMDAEYIERFMSSVTETRKLPAGAMDGYRKVLVSTVEKMDNHLDWNARQVYIALGQLMVAAAMLGVDTCPLEGIDTQAYDRLLGFTGGEYTTLVGCAVGYRHPEDAQSQAAKVRFDAEDLIVRF